MIQLKANQRWRVMPKPGTTHIKQADFTLVKLQPDIFVGDGAWVIKDCVNIDQSIAYKSWWIAAEKPISSYTMILLCSNGHLE